MPREEVATTINNPLKVEALQQIGEGTFSLRTASVELKKDKDVVLEAVSENGEALQFADASLRGDREIALEAMKTNGWALKYADDRFKQDRNFVLEVIKQQSTNPGRYSSILPHLPQKLLQDEELVLNALKKELEHSHSPNVFCYSPPGSSSPYFLRILRSASPFLQEKYKDIISEEDINRHLVLLGANSSTPSSDIEVREVGQAG